jgi:competence protein ComEA
MGLFTGMVGEIVGGQSDAALQRKGVLMSYSNSASIKVCQSRVPASVTRQIGWLVLALCVSAATAASAHAQVPAAPGMPAAPTVPVPPAMKTAAAKAAPATGPVDLNTASEAALVELPGVGPATAKAIIAGRPFASVDDLAKVKGIGAAKVAALRGRVTVAGGKGAPAPSVTPTPAVPAAPTAAPTAKLPPPPPAAMPTKPAAAGPAAGASRPSAAKAAKLAVGEKININTASAADLAKLPGIGPSKADKIVAGRPYAKPEDIMKVSGIKAGVFAKLKDSITVQ